MRQDVYAKLSVTLIIVVAIIRFTFALSYTISGDACWHLSTSRFIATQNKIPLFEGLGRLEPFWAPPAFHFFAAFLYKISNLISSEIADASMKLVSPIFGTLTVVIVYLITRKLFDARTAFYSMLFLNFVPLFLDYSVLSYVDSTAAFFSILSVYFMLNNKYILSSISFGLALLSKYNALFMLPMLIYLAYKNNKGKYTKLSIIIILPLFIASSWLLRNYVVLGNPFWPFLNGIFHGVELGTSFNKINFNNIFSVTAYLTTYLELFGVPNGNILLLIFYDIPYIKYLLVIWVISTIAFIFPFIKGLFLRIEGKQRYFLTSVHIVFLSYLFMLFIYLINTGWFGARLLLPVVPFISMIWAKGINSIKINKVYVIAALVISAGFIFTEVVKLSIASKEWSIYKQDFGWAKTNSKEHDVFYGNGQCLSYNINRLVIDHTSPLDLNKVDYVWVNNKWGIDFQMNENSFSKIKSSDKLKVVYDNPASGTTIYKVIKQ